MANTCRTEEKRFGFAGTKDRRGRTVQRLSVSFIGAKQLLGRETSARKNVLRPKIQQILGREDKNPSFNIRMFLGLPDRDPLVRVTDPDPDPSIIKQK